MSGVAEQFLKAVDRYIRPGTHPVAVCFLKDGDDAPAGYAYPAREFGERIALCQAVFLARRLGSRLVVTADDQACPAGQLVMGYAEPPEWWLDGYFDLEARRTATLEAGATMARSVFRFEPGQYAGVAIGPLEDAGFDPDVVLVYCNTLQATMLGMGARHKDGEPLRPMVSARFACADAIVQTALTNRCQLALPCGGERRLAGAQSDEVIFAVPFGSLADVVVGLDSVFSQTGTLHPSPVGPEGWLGLQTQLPGKYDKLSRLVGLAPDGED